MSPTIDGRASAGDGVGLRGVDLDHVPLQAAERIAVRGRRVAATGASLVALSWASGFWTPNPAVAATPDTRESFRTADRKVPLSDLAIATPMASYFATSVPPAAVIADCALAGTADCE